MVYYSLLTVYYLLRTVYRVLYLHSHSGDGKSTIHYGTVQLSTAQLSLALYVQCSAS